MYGGIDQLVNTYKGNPQPLQAKVQQAQGQMQNQMKQQVQQGQPPGAIPPDLEEALALQKITELRQGAQNQQAMQAGGAQPTVVQKLQQMLGGMQQQAQMPQAPQGQPVMAARGGSIAHLVSNLGQNYAGGGIVAFNGTTGNKVEDPAKESSSQFAQDIAQLPQAFDDLKQRVREEDAIKAEQDRRMAQYKQDKLAAQQKTSLFNYLFGSPEREKAGVAKLTELSNAPSAAGKPATAPDLGTIRSQLNAADAARFAEKPAPKPPVPVANAPAAPSPAANVGIGGGPAAPAKPAAEPTDPMEVALRKSIMAALAKDPEAIRKKAIEENTKSMGLDALLKPAQDRAAAREARIKEIQGSRQPLWIDALMSAGKPTRGGIAGVLQNMAVGAISGKQNYEAEDLKFLDELNKLNSEIDKARIEGRYKDVAAGKDAVKDLIAEQRQAEQSGTSFLTNKESARSRERIAEEGRLSRAQAAGLAAQARADAKSEKTDSSYREQAMKLAMAAALKEKQLPANMVRYKDVSAEQLAASMYDRIYNALKSGKMGAAPSAESPSGTTKPGWGIKPI
jgi:hypothetical protein